MQQNIVSNAERDEMRKITYHALIGSLLYLSFHTRLDLSFALNLLIRLVESTFQEHWKEGKRILRYLVGNPDIGITIEAVRSRIEISSEIESRFTAYSDSDWAGNISDRKSTGGYTRLLN